MSDYNEFKRLADELMHAVHLSVEDERYLHSPKFGGLLDELVAENESLRKVANELRRWASCEHVHHDKKDQHEYDQPCKVLARIDAALNRSPENP